MEKILVWDWPVRIGHWLLAVAFALAWLSGESERWQLLHIVAGAVVAGVVSFRLLWGIIGTRYARFSAFVRPPFAALAYLRSLFAVWRGRTLQANTPGHNPAGALAIVMLLALGLITAVSGWMTLQEVGGEVMEEVHEFFANTMLCVVAIHLFGVALSSWLYRENLPRTMITGIKYGNKEEAIVGAQPLAACLMLVWVAACVWFVVR